MQNTEHKKNDRQAEINWERVKLLFRDGAFMTAINNNKKVNSPPQPWKGWMVTSDIAISMLHKKVNVIIKVLMTGSSEVTVVRWTPKSEIPQSSKWSTRGDGGTVMLWSAVTLLGNLNEVQSVWVWAQPGWAQWSGGEEGRTEPHWSPGSKNWWTQSLDRKREKHHKLLWVRTSPQHRTHPEHKPKKWLMNKPTKGDRDREASGIATSFRN